jgi:hypothetical protein
MKIRATGKPARGAKAQSKLGVAPPRPVASKPPARFYSLLLPPSWTRR